LNGKRLVEIGISRGSVIVARRSTVNFDVAQVSAEWRIIPTGQDFSHERSTLPKIQLEMVGPMPASTFDVSSKFWLDWMRARAARHIDRSN
jgi:hypothetical protein